MLSGHYDNYDKQVKRLESQKTQNIHPVVQMNERVNIIKERMSDAQDIFARKFNLI